MSTMLYLAAPYYIRHVLDVLDLSRVISVDSDEDEFSCSLASRPKGSG